MDNMIELSPQYEYEGDFSKETAYRITKKMIESGDIPDALFLSNNYTSLGFAKAVFEEGLKIGKDICCVGFDKADALDVLNLNFSYVERDAANMGRIAMKMLLDQIHHMSSDRNEHIISAKLVLKGSERWE